MSTLPDARPLARAIAALGLALAAAAASPAAAQTIVGNGTEPTPSTQIVCPRADGADLNSAAVAVDGFTLTATPADTVTRVRVEIWPTNAYQVLERVEIRSPNLTTVYGSVTPTGDLQFIDLTTPIAVGATPVPLVISIVPKAQSGMPSGGAGAEYAIKAYVNTIMSTNARQYQDSTSRVVTVDNLAPANVIWTTITPGATNITLNWSASQPVVVVRKLGGPVTDVLTDGQTYSAPTTLASGGQIVFAGTAATYNDPGLTAGKAYYYKVFAKDACGNYSSGAALGPIRPGGTAYEGDSVKGSRRAVVGLINPISGVVNSPFRVQVRVFSPKSAAGATQAIGTVELVADNGTTQQVFPLERNSNYGTATDSGIFEELTPTVGVTLAPGTYTLRARATSAADAVTPVYSGSAGITVVATKGDGNLLVRDNSNQICSDCHTYKTHSSETTGTTYGSWYVGCRSCHDPHGTTNAGLVAKQITPPSVTGQYPPTNVYYSKHTGYSGVNGADSPASASYTNLDNTGPCQVCHTQTTVWTRNATAAQNAAAATSHNGTQQCTACHAHNQGLAASCTSCHGNENLATPFATGADSLVKAAPPSDHLGNTATSFRGVGGHQAHVNKAVLVGSAFPCTECHQLPNNHNGAADPLPFGPTAKSGGLAPAWDGTTCSSVWCHGAGLVNGGGTNKTPAWTGGPAQAQCGTCHGIPPPVSVAPGEDHPQNLNCGDCHAGYTATTVSATAGHINGTVSSPSKGCVSCHGDITQTTVIARTSPLAAPGANANAVDSKGNKLASVAGVGAHGRHVNSFTMANAFTCGECHDWPADGDTTHANGNGIPTFPAGSLATTGGAAPSYVSTSCSNVYCHGAKWTADANTRGTTLAPSWNAGSAMTCTSCHQAPPNTANHAGVVSGNKNCSVCHGAGYNCLPNNLSTCTVDKAQHVNGVVDAAAMTCSGCHGDSTTRTPVASATGADFTDAKGNNLVLAAPPKDAVNGSTGARVGAHVAHVNQGDAPGWSNALACKNCHAVPTTTSHSDGTAQVSWTGGIANARGATTTYDTVNKTCASSYCHGNFTYGNKSSAQLAWGNGTLSKLGCTSCHPNSPAYPHPSNQTCGDCHPGGYSKTGATTGTVAAATHVDGLTTKSSSGCTSCHGLLTATGVTLSANTSQAAPGYSVSSEDVTGATTGPAIGAHGKHLSGATIKNLNGGVAAVCGDCHALPASDTDVSHGSATNALGQGSRATVTFSNVAKSGTTGSAGTLTPTYGSSTTGSATPGVAGSCSNTYCHGGKWAAASTVNTQTRGSGLTPSWTGTPMNCGSCHQSPPATPSHSGVLNNKNCGSCHTNYSCLVTTGPTYTGCTVDLATHLNGSVDVATAFTCTNCHGQTRSAATTIGATDTNLAAAPPLDTTGATTSTKVGPHIAHVNPTAGAAQIYLPVKCNDCHPGSSGYTSNPSHADSTTQVNMTGSTAANLGSGAAVTWTAGTPGSCVTYCHGDRLAANAKGSVTTAGWKWDTTTNATCGACHGAAPNDPVHTSVSKTAAATACNPCHAGVVNATGAIVFTGTGAAATTKHIDGAIDTTGVTCTSCHGQTRANMSGGTVDAFQAAAPPLALNGSTATTVRGVGAHVSHVNKNSFRTNALACSECHSGAVPASTAFNHANGTITIAGGALALTTTQGNVGGQTQALTWNGATCANTYCHGNFRNGGAAAPTWAATFTNVAPTNTSSLTCTSCHAAPPGDASHTGVVSGNKNCSQCHGASYNCQPASLTTCTVDKNAHIDGTIGTVGVTCTSCHGSTKTVATTIGTIDGALLNAAPPADTAGSTTSNIVGPHIAHVNPSSTGQVNLPLACTDCHPSVATYTVGHANGTRNVALTSSTQANYGSGATVGWTAGSPGSCVTYCHGDRLPSGATITLALYRGTRTSWTWATGITAACDSCHALPPDPTGTHAGVAANVTACNGCHAETVDTSGNIIFTGSGASATTKHMNGVVDGGESAGGQACNTCHTFTATMASGTAHRHQMLASQPTSYPTTATAQQCLQCHVDHNIFRPDKNATAGVTRAKNLRTDITLTPTASANYTDTDFNSTLTNGGVCTSCHKSTLTKATGLPDAGATTPVVNATTYGAGAHNYQVGVSTFVKDSSTFKPNCSKCHNDTNTKKFQAAGNQFSLHNSTNTSVTAPLGSTVTGAMEENFCYRCHSKAADPIGGTTKSADANDWYGGVTNMPAPATGIYQAAAKAATTYTATSTATLYFRNAANVNPVQPASEPTAYIQNSGTYSVTTFSQYDLATSTGTSANISVSGGNTSARYTRFAQFASPPVNGTTTIASGSTIQIKTQRNTPSGYANVYERFQIWARNPTTNTNTPLRAAGPFQSTTAMPTTSTAITNNFVTDQAVTLNPGDYLVLELEMYVTTAPFTAANLVEVSNVAASSIVLPAAISWRTGSSGGHGHPVASYNGIHKADSSAETRSFIASNKHVECSDCHNTHAAGKGNGSDGGTTSAAGTTTTLTNSTKTWATNQWVGYYVTITSGTGVGQSSQITANTATGLTFGAVTTAPGSGAGYAITTRASGGNPSAATTTTLTDSAKAWPVNAWTGWYVVIQSGPGAGQVKLILSNTATALTLNTTAPNTAFTTTPTTASVYRIMKSPADELTGATGVDVATWATTTWTVPTAYNPSSTTANLVTANAQWQVCFKCHSAANANIASTGAGGWSAGLAANSTYTDLSLEFSPNNGSYHPIVQALPATDPGANGSSRLTAAQLTNGWKPGDLMTCGDCHNTDAASPAAQGPHGSAIKYMLAGVNKAWPYTTTTGTTLRQLGTATNNVTAGNGTNDGLFCMNCHPAPSSSNTMHSWVHSAESSVGRQHSGTRLFYACVACHLRVPHGGKVSRLIRTTNAETVAPRLVMPAATVQTPISTITKGTYSTNSGWNSGCGQHGNTSGGEAW